MLRREFFSKALSLTGLSFFFPITALAEDEPSQPIETPNDESDTVLVQDMICYAYFSAFLPPIPARDRLPRASGGGTKTGVLPAQAFLDDAPLKLLFWHHHAQQHFFHIDRKHLSALKRGQTVWINTTVADGHFHMLKIDPANVVARGPKIEVPLGPAPEEIEGE